LKGRGMPQVPFLCCLSLSVSFWDEDFFQKGYAQFVLCGYFCDSGLFRRKKKGEKGKAKKKNKNKKEKKKKKKKRERERRRREKKEEREREKEEKRERERKKATSILS